MFIHKQEVKETIKVFHNSREEMWKNIADLQKEGWSGNTRVSVVGLTLVRQELSHTDIEWLNENYPDLVIQEPEPNSYLYNQPYVYYTEHEKVLGSKGQISDGYHTFDELYYHRMVLFGVACEAHKEKAWKSWKHDDGTMFDNYFIVGIETPEGQYTYHYHEKYWDSFDVKELEFAPKWDGHQPKDITRLLSL